MLLSLTFQWSTHGLSSSVQYALPDRLRMHPAQAITLRASTNIQGMCRCHPLEEITYCYLTADLFEVNLRLFKRELNSNQNHCRHMLGGSVSTAASRSSRPGCIPSSARSSQRPIASSAFNTGSRPTRQRHPHRRRTRRAPTRRAGPLPLH